MSPGRDGTPFDEFRVEDEPMPDGRTIHYYVWPDSPVVEPEGSTTRPEGAAPTGEDPRV